MRNCKKRNIIPNLTMLEAFCLLIFMFFRGMSFGKHFLSSSMKASTRLSGKLCSEKKLQIRSSKNKTKSSIRVSQKDSICFLCCFNCSLRSSHLLCLLVFECRSNPDLKFETKYVLTKL